MGFELRVPTDDEWPAMCAADARTFGTHMTAEQRDTARRMIDLERYRIVLDGRDIVGVIGSYAFDVALPGGAAVPMAGVTWVSVAATHRRQGILTTMMEACHADVDERGEPVASLYASEAGIYGRFGYGLATQTRSTRVDLGRVAIRPELRPEPGAVRFLEGDDARAAIRDLWWRGWRRRAGEVRRTDEHIDVLLERRAQPDGSTPPASHLVHADGYATYRVSSEWDDGFFRNSVDVIEIVTLTAEASAAIWHTLLGLDLVATVRSRALAPDEPAVFQLTDPRALRTVNLLDGVWASVRDVPVAFGARTYGTDDRLVVEAGGRRWAIEGGPEGANARAVRSRPDVETDEATLGTLLYGGTSPAVLAAAGRLRARTDDVLRRAHRFFTTELAPHCQTAY